jgi:acyl-CoA synthetase (AMP-forming)/AMP-acid ligase II
MVDDDANQPAHLALLPDRRAAGSPLGECLTDDTVSLDNRTFLGRVVAAADSFRSRGVGPGGVVAVILPNQVDLVITLFAAWRLGAAVTPVNPQLTNDEIAHQLEDSGAEVVVGRAAAHEQVTLDVEELRRARPGQVDAVEPPNAERLALLIYTSGTTGRPKGVMLDHTNVGAMCAMIIDALRLTPDEHSLLILPLFHVNGIVVSVLSPLLAGGRATVTARFSARGFFPLVERVRPTYFSAVPAIYAMLTSLPAEVTPDVSSLRRVICGAAPMPAELITRFEARYGLPVVEGYGLSEGTCASTLNPPEGVRKPGTVGRPLAGQRVALMDGEGTLVTEVGATGEVVISGPNVMRGYLGRPDATAGTIINGWLHTGDVGQFDADGYLSIVDRIKDMIIRAGENIYPKEIENALHSHPAVLEAAVVGAPDQVLGEVPLAFVTLAPGRHATGEELIQHCHRTLARIKVPVRVDILDELPKNPVGKPDKPWLRKSLRT